MAKARDISTVNQKIIEEIDKVSAKPKIKQLLKKILSIELDNMDKEKVQYTNLYDEAFDSLN